MPISLKKYERNPEKQIPYLSHSIDNGTYDAFGLVIRNSFNTILYFSREGLTHVSLPGRIYYQEYNISSSSWSPRVYIYTDPTYDNRNVGGGIINGKIFIFFAKYNPDGANWISIGYIVSTDLTAKTWSDYTAIDVTPMTFFTPFSHIVQTANADTFLQPFYGWNGSTYYVSYFKTIDQGINWTVGETIYTGAALLTETTIEYIGANKLISLSRINGGGKLQQSTSANNGLTWSALSESNIGSVNESIPYLIYDSILDKVILIYEDRSVWSIKISITDALTAYTTAVYNTPIKIDSKGWLGYPSILKMWQGKYFFVHASELSTNNAITFWGFYDI